VKHWELDKRLEFIDLQKLIRTIASINHGNRFIENIEYCIDIATRLEDSQFMEFLRRKATGESDE